MENRGSTTLVYLVLVAMMLLLLAGCAKTPIRHLNADVSLLTQGNSMEQVVAIMGPPQQRRVEGGGEQWVYIVTKESFLRRLWVIGLFSGTADYEIVRLLFQDGQLASSSFRYATEAEFKKSDLVPQSEKGADE